MTTFEPGRIYSGVVDGERCHMIALDGRHFVRCRLDARASELLTPDRATDVRGPLVVLDANYYADCNWHDIAVHLRNGGYGDVANQVEEQTRPPLQVGWHEVEDLELPRYWTGTTWGIGKNHPTMEPSDYTSVRFIGK